VKLGKRKLWRPTDESGEVTRGGAGGFHLPQRADHFSYICPRPKRTRRRAKKAAA
jgi:hypothetical protein